MIPEFDTDGLLPPGIHKAGWDEITERFGWNAHRQHLMSGLYRALKALQKAGCKRVYLDGGFVTSKGEPADYDACWDSEGVDRLELDPLFLIFDNRRFAQKTKYYGEFFPASAVADEQGRVFVEFFQLVKYSENRKKGILLIDIGGLQ